MHTPFTPGSRLAALPAAVVLGVLSPVLVACGSETATQPSSAVSTAADGQEFTSADVRFLTGMIPHHAQAVAMVDLAEGREISSQVRSLMDEIKAAQQPEIDQMQGLLSDWGRPEVDISDPTQLMSDMSGMGDMEGMDHSGMDMEGMEGMGMDGMMSADMFSQLEKASDADFERLWLQMMVAHHEGAVDQAEAELEQGKNPEALGLAREIVRTQTAEIETMRSLLQG